MVDITTLVCIDCGETLRVTGGPEWWPNRDAWRCTPCGEKEAERRWDEEYQRRAGDPDTYMQLGDRIVVELRRGGRQNKDGIYSGGGWVEKAGTVVERVAEAMLVRFDDGDLQVMNQRFGNDGWPARNAGRLS